MHCGDSNKSDVSPIAASERTWQRLTHSPVVHQFRTAFSSVTGVPVTLLQGSAVSCSDTPAAEVGLCDEGCRNPQASQWCQRTLQAAKRKAAAEHRCVQFKCPSGLTKIIVPVAMGDRHLGIMLIGPFFLQTLKEKRLSDLRQRLKTFGLESQTNHLKAIWDLSPMIAKEKASAASELVYLFALYLSESANRLCLEDAVHGSSLLKRVEACLGEFQEAGVESRDVARRLKLSPCYFCKLFKKQTGMTFSEYRARRRVEKARQLLLNPSVRIGEVADACGFRSLPCFIRAFRRHQGCPPSQYRTQHRLLIPDKKTPIPA